MNRHTVRKPLLPFGAALAALVLAGCGGPGMATPTAIPASVVRPDQPTPAFSTAQPLFRLDEETPVPVFAATVAPQATPTSGNLLSRAELLGAFLMAQPPSAMGIATGGTTILAEQGGGAVIATVPPGGTVTVTGRSANGQWLAVFLEDASAGWVPADSLRLFGADDLMVVESAFSPAPVATLIAEARLPVGTPMAVLIESGVLDATPEPVAIDSGAALLGSVVSEGRLNLRAAPSAGSAQVISLDSGASVIVLGQNRAGDWLRVRTPSGDGWLATSFVQVEGDTAALPVLE